MGEDIIAVHKDLKTTMKEKNEINSKLSEISNYLTNLERYLRATINSLNDLFHLLKT